MRRAGAALLTIAILAAGSCTSDPEPLRIGAVYPISGSQGPGGVEEFHGVQVAVDLVNEDGGALGRQVELVPLDVPGADAAPGAIAALDADGVELVLGSYGSTISAPAAEAAARRGILFWETGAVG
ncbi:MAG: ABC transporter substrate-binding protein, partial [Actinomycetota bacterium]